MTFFHFGNCVALAYVPYVIVYKCSELYELPSRRHLTREVLPILYEEKRNRVLCLLASVDHVAITTDLWTGRSNEGYVTLTAHFIIDDFKLMAIVLSTVRMTKDHTAVNIAEELRYIFKKWCIEDKVHAVVSDNASNMINAVIQELKVRSVRCFAHTLNLIVQNAIKRAGETDCVRRKVKAVVAYFHHSVKATDRLKEAQKKAGLPSKKLKQDVETRWNSTEDMMKRYIELHQVVTPTLCHLSRPDLCLSDRDVDRMRVDLKALSPFLQVTEEMSSETEVTISKMLPLVHLLRLNLSKQPRTQLVQELQAELSRRYGDLESSTLAATATFLDPRFKSLSFTDKTALATIKDKIKGLLKVDYEQDRSTSNTPHEPTEEITIATDPIDIMDEENIWDVHDEQVAQIKEVAPTQITGPEMEMRRYIESPILIRKQDPLAWWRDNEVTMPCLSKLAKKILAIPATSVPSERMFSKAGELISARRSTLKSTNVDMLLFLNKNHHV